MKTVLSIMADSNEPAVGIIKKSYLGKRIVILLFVLYLISVCVLSVVKTIAEHCLVVAEFKGKYHFYY